MVIVRCFGNDDFYLERVIFPFDILSFSAPENAELEVWCHGPGGPELISTLSAQSLCSENPQVPAAEAMLKR